MKQLPDRDGEVIRAPRVEVLDQHGRPLERRPRRTPPLVTYLILAANGLVFFAFNASNLQGIPPLKLAYWPEEGQVFPQLLTYMFVHADPMHLLGNMFMVFFLGALVEKLYGAWRYLVIYLVAGIVSALAQDYFVGGGPLIGASGAASAVLAMFVRHFPGVRLYIYGVVPMPAWLFAILIVAFNIWGTVGAQAGAVRLPMNIAYLAHLAGLLAGIVLSLLLLPPGKKARQRARRVLQF